MKKEYRYEQKVVISHANHYKIENIIKHHPFIFSEIFYKRQINNIYLDTLDLKNYRDNLDGNAQRMKVRIRWYGKTFGLIKNPILELKLKDGQVGSKISFVLRDFQFGKDFSFKDLKEKVLKNSNIPLGILEKMNLLRPTLLNSYKREYFISANKKIRITLDEDLRFFRIKGDSNTFHENISNKNLKILEIKYSKKEDLSNFAKNFPFRIEAISKYVHGIEILD